jgi:hypothetical protein
VAVDFDVQIYGLQSTKRLMRELEPELLKDMNREIRDLLKPIAARAQSLIPSSPPLSAWGRSVNAPGSRRAYSPYGRRWNYSRLEWNSSEAKAGIVIRQGGGRQRGTASRAAWQIRSNNPAAAVFELMGRGKSNVRMVHNVQARFPADGRVLYRAWDSLGGDGRVEQELVGIIRRFEAEFNRRLDGAGDA